MGGLVVVPVEHLYDQVMFDQWLDELDKLGDPADADRSQLTVGHSFRDRIDAWLSEAVAAFDTDRQWEPEGAPSMTAWLEHHCRQVRGDAYRTVEIARKVQSMPVTAAAWRDGTLSSGQGTRRHLARLTDP
jgi:hypothetical protein